MPTKDIRNKEYLNNNVSNQLSNILKGDSMTIEHHMENNKSHMDKLKRMGEKHAAFIQGQKDNFGKQKQILE